MLIRSQNKKFLTDDLKFEIVTNKYYPETDDGEVIEESKIYNSTGLCFGTYSTEEKAIKVLDMIQDEYKKYATIESGFGGIHGAFNIPKCFEMPQDSEV